MQAWYSSSKLRWPTPNKVDRVVRQEHRDNKVARKDRVVRLRVVLARAIRARRALEVGVFTGYSSTAVAWLTSTRNSSRDSTSRISPATNNTLLRTMLSRTNSPVRLWIRRHRSVP